MKMKKKKNMNHGSLPEEENLAPRDYRGGSAEVRKRGAKAPDGISGDWGGGGQQ